MKWVRCPSCRTVNDVHRYAMCDGCNRDLTGVLPVDRAPSAPLSRAAAQDRNRTNLILWLIGGFLLLGTLVLPWQISMGTAVLSFFVISGIFMKLGLRGVWSARMGTLAKVGGTLLAAAASLLGALILVGLACSVSLTRANFG